MKAIKSLFLKYWGISIVLLVALISITSLFSTGLPPTHDGEYHVVRFQQFYKVLESGILYPRWAPDFNNGFGIPLFNYVYPLPNYVASLFHFLGFSFIDSFKLNMIFASIIGAIFFYLWTRLFWKNFGVVVSSILYIFSPYHFVDIYVRGSVGEVWSLALFPGLLWSFTQFSTNKKPVFLLASSILLCLLIFSHNILALLFFIFFISYCLFLSVSRKNKKDYFKNLIIILFIGLGLSTPFWLPALFESKYVTGLQIFDLKRHFPEIYQLIIPSWGYGFSGRDIQNQMSFQIGIANILAVLVAFIAFFKNKKNRGLIIFFIVWFFAIIFLMTPYSSWFWDNIPFFNYFQFPWRFLSLTILIASFLGGSIVNVVSKEWMKNLFASLLILVSIFLSLGYAKAPYYHKRTDSHYLTRSNFTDGTNSPGNSFNTKWLGTSPPKRKDKFEFFKGSGSIRIDSISPQSYKLTINAKEDSQIITNTAYFPGWIYSIDGTKIKTNNYNGRMLIKVPKEVHRVELIFSDTFVRIASYICFFISVLLLAFLGRKSIISIIRK